MVRPKSSDKHKAIMDAAIAVFAERGLASTPTSLISKKAEIAEGTLFTYFKTKDDLVNDLYRQLKGELASALMVDFPTEGGCRSKFFHMWKGYLNWAFGNPEKSKVMGQLKVSEKITCQTKDIVAEPFTCVEEMTRACIACGELRDIPLEFIAATMSSIGESTLNFMMQNPSEKEEFCNYGFEILWNGIAGPAGRTESEAGAMPSLARHNKHTTNKNKSDTNK